MIHSIQPMTLFSTPDISGIITNPMNNTSTNTEYTSPIYYTSPIQHQNNNKDSKDDNSSEYSNNSPINSPAINSKMAGCALVNLQFDRTLSLHAEETMNTAQASITIIDSGASRSGASDRSQLHSIKAVSSVQISGASGNTVQPDASGMLKDINIEALIVPGMQDRLLSVSQMCIAERDEIPIIGVFSDTGVTFYSEASILEFLNQIKITGEPTMHGSIHNGVYKLDAHVKPSKSCPDKSSMFQNDTMLAVSIRSSSLYDHLHAVTNHGCAYTLAWHRKFSKHANLTAQDQNTYRPICAGCALGSSRQTSTDHNKTHRERPTTPGQNFTIDAYSHNVQSIGGYKYTDILTDSASGRRHVVFTRDRKVSSVIAALRVLFLKNPLWSVRTTTLKTI